MIIDIYMNDYVFHFHFVKLRVFKWDTSFLKMLDNSCAMNELGEPQHFINLRTEVRVRKKQTQSSKCEWHIGQSWWKHVCRTKINRR